MKKDSAQVAIFRLERMRRFSVVVLAVAVMASMAGAAHGAVAKTSGAASLQLAHGAGLAKVRNLGSFFGRIKRGTIVATPNVRVNGCEARGETNENMTRCKGRDITFNTFGAGKWRLRLRGRGIAASGFVSGCLVLDGRQTGPTGTYQRGDDEPKAWPRERRRFALGSGSC
jgi:hypothetical protein